MKKLVYLLALVLLLSSLKSCTNDSDNSQELQNENISLFQNKKINSFLGDYYEGRYSKGEVLESEINDVIITSVVSDTQESPIGYVFSKLTTDELLYFIDVNFESNEVTSIDFIKGESLMSDDFFINNGIDKDKGFDLIKEIRDNDLLLEKRPFWGTSCGPVWYIGDEAFQTCCHYVFWIQNGCSINQL